MTELDELDRLENTETDEEYSRRVGIWRGEFPPTLALSVVRALGELQNIEATEEGQAGAAHFKYGDLAHLLTAVRPVLQKYGLALTQTVTNDDGRVTVKTMLVHWTGEPMVSDPLSLPTASTPQGVGSAITYARRYSARAMLGLADEDDDGQEAAAKPVKAPAKDTPIGEALAAPFYTFAKTKRGLVDEEIADLVADATDGRTTTLAEVYHGDEWKALRDATAALYASRQLAEEAPVEGADPVTADVKKAQLGSRAKR